MKISHKINTLVAISAFTLIILGIVNTEIRKKNNLVYEQNQAISQIGGAIQNTLIYQLEFQDDFSKEASVYQSLNLAKGKLKQLSENLLIGVEEVDNVSQKLELVEVQFQEYAKNLKTLQDEKSVLNLHLKTYIVSAKTLNAQIEEEIGNIQMMGEDANPMLSSMATISRGILISLNEYLVALNQELLLENNFDLFQQRYDEIQSRLAVEKRNYLALLRVFQDKKYKGIGTELVKLFDEIQEKSYFFPNILKLVGKR